MSRFNLIYNPHVIHSIHTRGTSERNHRWSHGIPIIYPTSAGRHTRHTCEASTKRRWIRFQVKADNKDHHWFSTWDIANRKCYDAAKKLKKQQQQLSQTTTP